MPFTDFADEGATVLALLEYRPDDCRLVVAWYREWRRVTDLGLGALRERFRNLKVIEPDR